MLRSVREMCDCFAGCRLGVRVRAVAVKANDNANLVPVMVVCAGSTTESFVFLQLLLPLPIRLSFDDVHTLPEGLSELLECFGW